MLVLPKEIAVPGSRQSISLTSWLSRRSWSARQVPTISAPSTVTHGQALPSRDTVVAAATLAVMQIRACQRYRILTPSQLDLVDHHPQVAEGDFRAS